MLNVLKLRIHLQQNAPNKSCEQSAHEIFGSEYRQTHSANSHKHSEWFPFGVGKLEMRDVFVRSVYHYWVVRCIRSMNKLSVVGRSQKVICYYYSSAIKIRYLKAISKCSDYCYFSVKIYRGKKKLLSVNPNIYISNNIWNITNIFLTVYKWEPNPQTLHFK